MLSSYLQGLGSQFSVADQRYLGSVHLTSSTGSMTLCQTGQEKTHFPPGLIDGSKSYIPMASGHRPKATMGNKKDLRKLVLWLFPHLTYQAASPLDP